MLKLIQFTRFCIYTVLGGFDYLFGRTNPITILAYHGIADDSWRFTVSKATFKRQILALKQKYTIISLPEIEAYLKKGKSLKKPCVAITFDDGYKNILSIKEMVKDLGVKPTVFALSDTKHANTTELGLKSDFLSLKELKSLSADGWTIGCHSATHPDFAKLSESQTEKEIVTSKKNLEKMLAKKVNYFAYPKGKYSPAIIKMLEKAKYALAFSMDDAKIIKTSPVLTLPRVGIDRSHSLSEFRYTMCPSVIAFRRFIKNSLLNKYVTL